MLSIAVPRIVSSVLSAGIHSLRRGPVPIHADTKLSNKSPLAMKREQGMINSTPTCNITVSENTIMKKLASLLEEDLIR